MDFNNVVQRYDVRYCLIDDGDALRQARLKFGGTLIRMAFLCNWSPQYHWKLENGEVKTLTEEAALKIVAALTRLAEEVRAS